MTNNNEIMEMREKMAELKLMQVRWNNLQNEGGDGYNPYDAKIAELSVKLDAAEFAAKWPREETIARRERWNAWLHSAGVTIITPTALRQLEEGMGFRRQDLVRAVKMHNL